MFIASGLEFVPNNYSAPLANENAPEAFHLIQSFLTNSDIGTALTAPSKLSASQIRTFWQTGTYDDGGESGSPSIIFEVQGEEFIVTPTTVRDALGLEDFNAFTTVGDFELVRMMREIGYSGPLSKIGQLKRPLLRKEWSFFFDCITRAFGKKCTNWDAIPTDSLQIGYSLLYGSQFDVARLVLTNIGEKMLENRNVVYFSRFCQLIFNFCCPNVEIVEDDVILSFKLHKRIFSDLTNKDNKKGDAGLFMLPESVQQFLDNLQQPQLANTEAGPSVSQPQRSKKSKVRAVKSARVNPLNTEAGASNADVMPQKRRMKKRRANRAKSDAADAVDAETETDEETLHQRKRRLVAAHLFGAENISSTVADDIEIEIPEVEVVPEDRIFMETVLQDEAPTSKSDDVVEEAANDAPMPTEDRANVEIADEAPENIVQEANMEVEANLSINSEHFTEGLEADQDTVQLEESMASHIEIISLDLEKGEEVDQTLAAKATETVAANPDVADKDATENVPFEAEFVANSEDVLVLEALQQSVVEIVQQADFSHTAHSDDPERMAENVLTENEAEDDNAEASPAHSNPDIQVELSNIQANSEEEREVNRATTAYYQDMYFSNWSRKDTIFSNERAADFVTKSSKEIKNPELLSHLKATIVQIKSLNNHFDDSDKVIAGLRNDIATRELTQQKDKSLYISLCKEQKNFNSRLLKVEDNQTAMSAQLTSISTAIELLTSVLLFDDVKKGESVPSDKCKDTQTLRRRDDGNDGGNKGGDGKSLRSNDDRRLLSRRSNSDKRSNSGKGHVNSASGSRYKSLIISDKPSTDEEIAAKMFMAEHGKGITIEDIQAEEQMLAEEHKKNVEAGIYKKKEIKAPRKKEKGIVIKENVNSDQSLQYSRRRSGSNADKGKGVMIEEPNLNKKFKSTSDIAQVETRLAKSTSDAAQVDVITKVMTTSDVAQVVQKSTQLTGFTKPKILEDLKLEAVNFSETRTVLGKEAFDKSGLGSHRERRTNNRSQDNISLAEPGIGVIQENLDKLESVQLIFHKILKKQFLLYFMSDGRVYKVGESDVNLKSWEELEYVLYLLKVKNRYTHDVAQVLREKMLRSKAMLGGGVSSVYIPKYRDHTGKLVEMKKNSARFRTALNKKVLEFNLESDKAFYIRLGNEMNKNSIYSLRAAIYQIGEDKPELKELKKDMIAELDRAERKLLIDYLRTVPDIEEVK
ncbi:hypothetical protein POM88_053244 [Heracleum sosnowskyi]|uniref:Uncharacterized protein n=1 Tax=Heracleum sosnowskyi TaxID=360622 RepID=A0AAD8LXU6_9APIA|nr:hypothetical protein POM88_053244 [Heracleum sosnowskyi]